MSRPAKCKYRGCKNRPLFSWQLCAIGDFELCDVHDLMLNSSLAYLLKVTRRVGIIQRYRVSARRRDHIAKRLEQRGDA